MSHPSNQTQGGSGGGSMGRIALMLVGIAAAGIGMVLMLQSYSTHPTKFYVGLILLVVGGGTAAVLALKQDRREHQPKKRNGDTTRRRNA